MDISTIDQMTIDEMVSLLDDKSDSVRGRMAIALGIIGPAAKGLDTGAAESVREGQGIRRPIRRTSLRGRGRTRSFRASSSADSICFALAKLEATARRRNASTGTTRGADSRRQQN